MPHSVRFRKDTARSVLNLVIDGEKLQCCAHGSGYSQQRLDRIKLKWATQSRVENGNRDVTTPPADTPILFIPDAGHTGVASSRDDD